MAKRKKSDKSDSEFYSLDEIKKRNADYNVIFGERSNGKTYAVLFEALEQFAKDGSQLGLIRRYQEDFRGKRGTELFNPLVANNVVKVLTDDEWTHVYYYSGRWYLCKYEQTEKETLTA